MPKMVRSRKKDFVTTTCYNFFRRDEGNFIPLVRNYIIMYTTIEKIENYILQTIDPAYYDTIDRWIESMSKHIDNVTKRTIFIDGGESAVETYKYDGDGSSILLINDCHSIQEVRVDGVAVDVLEYPTTKEYTSRIVLESGYKFTVGNQNVEVDAIHASYPEIPSDIEFACTVLVAGIVNNLIFDTKGAKSETIGNYTVSYEKPIQIQDYALANNILSTYRRIAL